jgi:hypothetical protein
VAGDVGRGSLTGSPRLSQMDCSIDYQYDWLDRDVR